MTASKTSAARKSLLQKQIKDDEAVVSKARGKLEKLLAGMVGLKEERDGLDAQRSLIDGKPGYPPAVHWQGTRPAP